MDKDKIRRMLAQEKANLAGYLTIPEEARTPNVNKRIANIRDAIAACERALGIKQQGS